MIAAADREHDMGNYRSWSIVVGSAGLFVLVVAAGNYLLTAAPAPLTAVKTFYYAADHGSEGAADYQRAYAQFHPELQSSQPYQEFLDLATTHGDVFRATRVNWSTQIEGESATVEAKIVLAPAEEGTPSEDERRASARFRLAEHDGAWKIVAYRIEDDSTVLLQGGETR